MRGILPFKSGGVDKDDKVDRVDRGNSQEYIPYKIFNLPAAPSHSLRLR